jgi:hypothetical protein
MLQPLRDGQPWRAMLLKDSEGDLGICVARWVVDKKVKKNYKTGEN